MVGQRPLRHLLLGHSVEAVVLLALLHRTVFDGISKKPLSESPKFNAQFTQPQLTRSRRATSSCVPAFSACHLLASGSSRRDRPSASWDCRSYCERSCAELAFVVDDSSDSFDGACGGAVDDRWTASLTGFRRAAVVAAFGVAWGRMRPSSCPTSPPVTCAGDADGWGCACRCSGRRRRIDRDRCRRASWEAHSWLAGAAGSGRTCDGSWTSSDAASSGSFVDGFGDIVVVVAGIDSCYFRHFRFHPCTMATAAAGDSPDLSVSSWPSRWLTLTTKIARSRATMRAAEGTAACTCATINHRHLFRSRRRTDRGRLWDSGSCGEKRWVF